MTTYTTAISFPTMSEAMAHLDLFDYKALPVRNRYSNRSFGDLGESRIGFAYIESRGDYVDGSEVYQISEYIVHEVDRPLKEK